MTRYINRLWILLIFAIPLVNLGAEDNAPVAEIVEGKIGNNADAEVTAPEVSEKELNAIDIIETKKRKVIYDSAAHSVKEGKLLVADQKYTEANIKFVEAEKILESITGKWVQLREKQLINYIKSFRIKWAKSIENEAYREYINKNYDAAIIKVSETQLIPSLPKSLENELKRFVTLCQNKIEQANYKEKTSLEYKDVDPDNKIRNYEIDVAMRKAKMLLSNNQLVRARDAFEKILVRDPYNFKATYELKKLYKSLRKIGIDRRNNDKLERMAEITWKWNEAVLPSPAKRPEAIDTIKAKTGNSTLMNKLDDIIIKNINFSDVNIQTVVKYLADQSKRLDTLGNGINIALGMSEKELSEVPTVTMNLENLPLGEVIRYLCLNCGLKYRVNEHVLTIGTDAINPMDTRFFKVRAALITRIAPMGGGDGGDDDDNDLAEFDTADTFGDTFDGDDSGKKTKRSITTEALKAYFTERGVPFPEGSTIAYDKRAGKLVVKNTHENLRRLDSLLRALDLEQPLVLIESKFIETRQRDLEELGFEWWMSNNPPSPGDYSIAPNNTLVRPAGGNVDGVNSPVTTTAGKILNNVAFPVFGGKYNFSVGMMLHALDQHLNAEILSSPKVISKSGEEAIIRMVREEFYPESWTEPELAIINGLFSYTPPNPEFGEATDIGIRFIVTPTVSPNNYTITLALNPQVLALSGWSTYDIPFTYPTFGGGQANGNSIVKMPEISRRDVVTNVRVYDGDTIVLGGMLTEQATGNDDRFPGTGEIPLLGILGRVQVTQNFKVNLLIFVTARIVNPDGLPVRISPNNGLFDFRR